MLNPQKESTKVKNKTNVYDKSSDLYNDLLAIYFNKYNELRIMRC